MTAGFLFILFGLIAVYMFTGTATAGTEVDPVDTSTRVYPQYVNDFADAIAFAEGFGVSGARPTVSHNPGDIFPGGDTSGFASDAEGWEALRHQVNLMFNGGSHYYNSGMSVSEVAAQYTQTEQSAWASNVVYHLNMQRTGFYPTVTTDTTLDEIRGPYAS